MKKKLFALIIFAFATFPVLAAEWQQFSEKQYIDISSIKPYNDPDTYGKRKYNRDEKEFWIKHLNDKGENFTYLEKLYNKKIWFILYKELLDCKNKTIASQSGIFFDTKGIQIDKYVIEPSSIEREAIIPDTLPEYLYNTFCGYSNTKNEPEIEMGIVTNDNNYDNIVDIFTSSPYLDNLYEKIKKHWKPKHYDISLECEIIFTIAKDGKLVKYNVLSPSINPNFDKEVIKALQLAAPFKPLPKKFDGESIDMRFTFKI